VPRSRRQRRRLIVAALAAATLAHSQALPAEPPPALLSPPAAVVPTIALEAEAGLVGRAVTVSPGPLASAGGFVHFSGPAQPPPADGVRVAGNRLLRDGEPYVPAGFTLVALVHPNQEGGSAWASRRLGPETMEAARAWGANTIRYQVSQRGLDPTDPLFSQAYLDRIVAGVTLARSYGFVVVLSIQDQSPSGGDSHAQPSDATIRDWQTLTALFNGDQHVVYEIFNEPQNKPTPDGWEVWRNGGPAERNQGTPAVGHQRVLEAIRATGATNVVIAEGSQFAQRLDGIPLLHDPLGQVAYGVHPYLTHTLREPDDWEPGFGFLSSQFPVVATEWTAVPGVRFCKPEWETTSPLLVDFLQERDIGMLAWAFDVLDTLVADGQHTPTSLEGFQCGDQYEHGPGTLIKAQMAEWRPSPPVCGPGHSDEGTVALPVDVAVGGTYRLWSRVRPLADGTDSAVSMVRVDDACPVPAWDGATGSLEPWSWRTGDAAVLNLTPGRHTLRFLGGPGPVNLDRVMLSADDGCVPEDPTKPCSAPTTTSSTTTTTMKPKPAQPTTTTVSRPRRPPRPPRGRAPRSSRRPR
jgi:hypothetical protein